MVQHFKTGKNKGTTMVFPAPSSGLLLTPSAMSCSIACAYAPESKSLRTHPHACTHTQVGRQEHAQAFKTEHAGKHAGTNLTPVRVQARNPATSRAYSTETQTICMWGFFLLAPSMLTALGPCSLIFCLDSSFQKCVSPGASRRVNATRSAHAHARTCTHGRACTHSRHAHTHTHRHTPSSSGVHTRTLP